MEKTLVRHEELDQELGGITYVAEYSNQYSSNYSFFLSASLSAFAPAGSEAVMSATDVNGNPLSRKMLLSKENLDYRNGFTGDFFKSGEYGARRGICTVTVGNGEEQEVYKILVTRTLALNDLTCSDSSDGESIFNEKRFFSNVFDYTASITDQVKQVYVKATIKQEEGYSLFINGQPWESGEELEIPISRSGYSDPCQACKGRNLCGRGSGRENVYHRGKLFHHHKKICCFGYDFPDRPGGCISLCI